ncbi:phosphatase PAP2 family protein [Allobranchiibius huperziae]|uniref:Undecaprenyl-diphosphatase n=1 Tax=Allobranchiibius huperziae TaxID=1874116 RepID=A0A853DCV7_9MICO|nr:undecaprenyl-diphosphatase [Allobranchiibius huperziae]
MGGLTLAGALMVLVALSLATVCTRLGARRTGELRVSVWATHHDPGWGRQAGRWIDSGFGTVGAVVMIVLVLLVLLVGGRRRDVVVEAALFFATWGACSLVKHVAERARPPAPPVRRTVALQDPYSMPSGHTAIATGIVAAICFTVWLGQGSHRVALGIGIPVVLVVAASRVFVGAHYLGDVTVAMLLGAGVCLLVLALGRGLGRITPDLQGSEPLHRPARRT